MKVFNIQLTEDELKLLGAVLAEQPFKISAPLIANLNKQMVAQQQTEEAKEAA